MQKEKKSIWILCVPSANLLFIMTDDILYNHSKYVLKGVL